MPRLKGEHSPTRALGRAVNAVFALGGRVDSAENPAPTGIFPTDTAGNSGQQPDTARE